jgi:hypothetical protein
MVDPTAPESRADGVRASAAYTFLRSSRLKPTVLVLGGGVVVAAACWFFGTDAWHAITIGGCLGAIGVAWVAVPDHPNVSWRDDDVTSRKGARSDVVNLSWSLRPRYGRVQHTVLRRVQGVARYRLSERQLDLLDPLDRPEIERLIGSAAYAVLSSSGSRPPLLRSIVRCLDILDALAPSGTTAQAPVDTRPMRENTP